MKKILFVNNNLETGGIQKALINMLKSIHNEYDITLLLFSKTGSLISEIPENVKVITPKKSYAMLGLEKKDLINYPMLLIYKMFMKIITRLCGKMIAMNILGCMQKKIGTYDAAFSVTHLTDFYNFNNGCAEFVLNKVNANKKICFVHCDYVESGYVSKENNDIYKLFEQIICVSKSVKKQLINQVPEIESKTIVINNFYDFSIKEKSSKSPVIYDERYINIVIVARLSSEKGIDRVLESLEKCRRQDIRIHIIGDGPLKNDLYKKAEIGKLLDKVFFYGERSNPYRFMKYADYLMVSSIHEAAPMVFDEAHILNIPIISTKLLSSSEMLNDIDIICENSCDGIESVLINISKKNERHKVELSNDKNFKKMKQVIEG